jgi:hypothetical protein
VIINCKEHGSSCGQFQVLSWCLPGGTEESMRNLSHDSEKSHLGLKPGRKTPISANSLSFTGIHNMLNYIMVTFNVDLILKNYVT